MNNTIDKFIEENRKTIIELETLLSSIPAISPVSGGEGEAEKARALENWLRGRGFDNFTYINAPDERVPSGIRPNLILTVPGRNSGRTLWIMSHLDVVPPGNTDLWETDPFTVTEKNGRLYGRGTEDNQQGMVCSVMAALALKENGIVPEYNVKLLFVADEEVGSDYGIIHIIDRYPDLFSADDLVLVPDSGTATGDEIQIAEKNVFWFRITTEGVQCHGAYPSAGKNAFLAGCDLAIRLHSLQDEYSGIRNELFDTPYSTFSPTKKEANVPNVNTIPGSDIFYMDCRVLPEIDTDEVMAKIGGHCRAVEEKHGVKVTVEPVQHSVSKASDMNSEICTRLKKAILEVSGREAKAVGSSGATVAAHLRNLGLNVAVWSTIEDSMHMPNEYAVIDNLVNDAKVMARLMI